MERIIKKMFLNLKIKKKVVFLNFEKIVSKEIFVFGELSRLMRVQNFNKDKKNQPD